MKNTTAPYINFQGRAREAMEHYHAVFGGKLSMFAASQSGTPRQAEPGDPIMYARLEGDGVRIQGSDGNPNFPTTVGDNIAIVLAGTDREWLVKAFDRLAEGGKVKGAIRKGPWGGEAGWLQDKFGINWNIDVESE